MDELVKQVVARAGINETQARAAIQAVADFAKTQLPPALAGQVDAFMAGNLDLKSNDPTGGLLGGLGSLFGG